MSPALEQLKKEISQLPPDERHALWRSLNEEFDPLPAEEDDEASIEAAWDEEIANRVQEIKDGSVQLLSSEDFESQIQAHLNQLRGNRKPQST
jgi:putative addiction module component (TIGR02574 family)